MNESYGYALGSSRLASISGGTPRSFTYDGAGNAANDNRASGAYVYSYDQAGNMAGLSRDGLTIARYTSDARGLRAVKDQPGGAKTHFLHDEEGKLLAEHDGVSGAALREVIWLEDLPVGWVDAAALGAPLYFVHADHLNQPRKLTDATGAVVWDGVFGPFGEAVSVTGSLGQNLRFPGQYADGESVLSHNWRRTYDPSLGRYLQSDPIGLAGGINTYAYVGGNPVRYVDPSGELGLAGAGYGAIAGGVGGYISGGWSGAALGAGAGALVGFVNPWGSSAAGAAAGAAVASLLGQGTGNLATGKNIFDACNYDFGATAGAAAGGAVGGPLNHLISRSGPLIRRQVIGSTLGSKTVSRSPAITLGAAAEGAAVGTGELAGASRCTCNP